MITNKEYMNTLKMLPFSLVILCLVICSCNPRGNVSNTSAEDKKDSTIVNDDKQKVSVMVLRYGNFNKEIISNGKLIALKKADLKFRSSENVAAVYVKNGDRVEKGQTIAKLDNFTLTSTLKQNLIQYEKAKVDLQDVIMSLGYSNKDTSLIPDITMNTARARSGIDKAQSDLELAEYNLRASVPISSLKKTTCITRVKSFAQ
jgi:multidrug efflux pump subunit AcrA (membrane-fusion protein)